MPGFFAPSDPDPDSAPRVEPRRRMPPWMGAPAGVVPGIVPLERVMATGDGVALAVTDLRVYPAGLSFSVLVLTDDDAYRRGALELLFADPGGRRQVGSADETLRIGVELPDGRRVGDLRHERRGPDGPEPRLLPTESGGSSEQFRFGFWLWPLPDHGTWSIVVQWPENGIGESWLTLDGTEVAAAAARANVVYSDAHRPLLGDDDGTGDGWAAYGPIRS